MIRAGKVWHDKVWYSTVCYWGEDGDARTTFTVVREHQPFFQVPARPDNGTLILS
jgi:hypothetical protein